MNIAGLVRYAGASIALATFSACGGSAIAPPAAALDGGLAIPGVTSKAKAFAYIVDAYGSYASIFSYPKGDKQIGKIKNVGGQACTNALNGYGKKTFWIMAGPKQITEYNVPKQPIKTLSVPLQEMPSSCAIAPNGDFIIGILDGLHSGNLVIFKNASGKGKNIVTPLAREFFEGYDNKGNLFFDGETRDETAQLDEMAKGGTKITAITTSNIIHLPGSIQWDGTYLTVTDMVAAAMYRYTVSGTTATLESTVPLTGAGECTQTWITTNVVLCADAGNNAGEIYKYPDGGSMIGKFKGQFDMPLGVVVVQE